MRIRKLATQILGAAPLPFDWLAGAAASAASSPAPAPPPEESFCQTNRSPWDVVDSPSDDDASMELHRRRRHHLTEPKPDVKDELLTRYGNDERGSAIVALPSTFACKAKKEPYLNAKERRRQKASIGSRGTPPEETMEAKAAIGTVDVGRSRRPQKKRTPKLPSKKKKAIAPSGCEAGVRDDGSTPPPLHQRCTKSCKKRNGREWRCKNRVELPTHKLCDHHLSKSLSYKKMAPPPETVSDFYYYYSGFGPWRGKARFSRLDACRGDDGGDREGDNVAAEEFKLGGDAVKRPRIRRGVEEDFMSSDGGEEEEGGGARVPLPEKNKKRKRIKARSLKSLM